MTLPLRKKRPTTVRGRNTWVRKTVELASLAAWLLLSNLAHAQYAPRPFPAGLQAGGALPNPSGATQQPLPVLPDFASSAPVPVAKMLPPTPTIQQTAGQGLAPGSDARSFEEQALQDIQIQLEPPGRARLFLFPSEKDLQLTLIQEGRNRNPPDKVPFPEEPVLTRERYYGRNWPAMVCSVEPNYVGYNRLLLEQKNAERFAWDLGPVHAVISPLVFFKDVMLLPYHSFTDPFRCYEYNTGYPLTGDPVPLLLYPPEISFTGALAETSAVLAVLAVFP